MLSLVLIHVSYSSSGSWERLAHQKQHRPDKKLSFLVSQVLECLSMEIAGVGLSISRWIVWAARENARTRV